MKLFKKITLWLIGFFVSFSSYAQNQNGNTPKNNVKAYDMRKGLTPSRLTIAMWDFSWLNMHYPGGAFSDFAKAMDELIQRGFNTVRIDAFPLIIGKINNNDQKITISAAPLENWGATDMDRKHAVVTELVDFMKIAKKKNISVILSSWAIENVIEFPNLRKDYTDPKEIWKAWEKVLDILKEEDLLSPVVYVDFDQEFPHFSPLTPELNHLGQQTSNENFSASDAMEAAGNVNTNFDKLNWNPEQMNFVRSYLTSTLNYFQKKYPELRFTFSFTTHWKEVRAMHINNFDVLELHFWMSQSERFNTRTGFNALQKDRGEHDYNDYMDRVEKTMKSIRPMLMKDMHNRLAWAKEWSEELAAPLVTTEAWGPWWHMDHHDLDWKWLYDWCKESMNASSDYELWGATPWNYSHPYWENWKNVEWYNQLNRRFLEN